MRCDRRLTQIRHDEVIDIEARMKIKKEHGHDITPFLSSNQRLRYVIRRDLFTLAQQGYQIQDIKTSLGRILKTFKSKSSEFIDEANDSSDSFVSDEVQYYHDSNLKFKHMISRVSNRSSPPQSGGIQVIAPDRSILPKWVGDDPFKKLPMWNSQWSQKTRMQMKILDPKTDKEYVVAEIEWNGSHKCPFQHIEDKSYHGYEYGCRDYIVTNDSGKQLAISDLSVHMIDKHDFFGGDNPYRLDPLELVEFLGLDVSVAAISDRPILLPIKPFVEPSIEECLQLLFNEKISEPSSEQSPLN